MVVEENAKMHVIAVTHIVVMVQKPVVLVVEHNAKTIVPHNVLMDVINK